MHTRGRDRNLCIALIKYKMLLCKLFCQLSDVNHTAELLLIDVCVCVCVCVTNLEMHVIHK